ncbi:MAG: DUF1553 domain-containing protein [Planctomycetota bacterium]|nr:DUF1553 domain-containing protein [Planctomycetota bacterium]
MKTITIFFMMVLCACSTLTAKQRRIDFTRDIKPILSDRCYKCHGPDGESREADLRLDLRASAQSALSSMGGQVIAPGKPNHSALYLRIADSDADFKMPPPESNLTLKPAEIALIRQWIQQGAPWDEHWSFELIRKPELPHLGKSRWIRNEVDRFILQRLKEEGLSPAAEAEPETLIRRLAFDITGLPPTFEMLDRYVRDPSDTTYAEIVDELLSSKHYGERMAADWLDVARYSDTYGYQVDRDRYVWPYRDWVIRAFNDNLPYNQFITEQIAGDLLPEATDDQRLATTFNRLHSQKVEGGSTPEEFRVEYVADRTHTFATAFLGITLECCRCHDHKYDPFSQQEYYQLFAYFNNIDEAGLYSYFTSSVPTPTLRLTTEDQKKKIAELAAQVRVERQKLATVRVESEAAFTAWLKMRPLIEDHDQIAAMLGEVEHLTFTDTKSGSNKVVEGKFGNAIELSGDDAVNLSVGNYTRSTPFTVGLWMKTPDRKERAVVFHRSRACTDSASRGYQLLIEQGQLSASLIHFWPGNAIRIRTSQEIPVDQWIHVAMVYDGSSTAAGVKIYVNGVAVETYIVRDHLYKNITGSGGENIAIGQRFRDKGFAGGVVDEFRVFSRALTPLELRYLAQTNSLSDALSQPVEQIDKSLRAELRDFFLAVYYEPYGQQLAVVKQARDAHNQLADGLQEIMVMQEMPKRRPTYVLSRGEYNQRQAEVQPGTPAIFPLSAGGNHDRLALARWLTDPQHPLASRVAVNRIWQLLFGQGLVRTPEDFGNQGALPTHPQLLDWLASTLMDNHWNIKDLIRQLVCSSTYRQSSSVSAEILQKDPENRWLSHANRFQFPAEMLRDNVLFTCGLLVDKQGGASVKPYEVAQSFKAVSRGKGDALYRRSVYTYWKRTGPAPVMMALDSSKRDICNVKRERTASPLHAIVLMNDPQLIEAARVLGQTTVKVYGPDVSAAVAHLFRKFTSRSPRAEEQRILLQAYQQQAKYFKERPEQTEKFLQTGDAPVDPSLPAAEVAAMGMLVNLLINYDECATRR